MRSSRRTGDRGIGRFVRAASNSANLGRRTIGPDEWPGKTAEAAEIAAVSEVGSGRIAMSEPSGPGTLGWAGSRMEAWTSSGGLLDAVTDYAGCRGPVCRTMGR